jgi:hypothetical protein
LIFFTKVKLFSKISFLKNNFGNKFYDTKYLCIHISFDAAGINTLAGVATGGRGVGGAGD